MAIRSKNKTKPMDKELAKQITLLEIGVEYSLRAIDGKHEILDQIFKEQVRKLQKEINKLRKNNDLR